MRNYACLLCTRGLKSARWTSQNRSLTTSVTSLNSGRFRKMKQVTPEFLRRTGEKKLTAQTNTVFDPEYLDSMVKKMLALDPGGRLHFLKKNSTQNLPEDEPGVREDIVKDWNHIHETVLSLGVPELADIVGGQLFAGAHSRTTSTTCLTYRMADNLDTLTDYEVEHLIIAISEWPGDAGSSESLNLVLTKLDGVAAERCLAWEDGKRLRLALAWAAYPLRPSQSSLCLTSLRLAGPCLADLHLAQLLHFLLIVSYRVHDKEMILEDLSKTGGLEHIESIITRQFNQLNEAEVAVVYSSLNFLSAEHSIELGRKIHNTYGFRL